MGLGPRRSAVVAANQNGPDGHKSTGGRLVYGVGDIHGRYDLLKALLAKIAADAEGGAKGRRPVLIFCGDYVDRGPQSAEVIQALLWLRQRPQFDVRLLKGNHEASMLDYIAGRPGAEAWLRYGGDETLRSYGVEPPPAKAKPAAHAQARDSLLETMPAAHLWLLQSLPLTEVAGDYVFVHAGVRRGAALADQREEDLLWIRQGFVDQVFPFEKMVIHGHTWTGDQPETRKHRIGIDTGAYATGVLTAVRLDDGEMSFLQARV
jgi:serine/threonine protein phosphatase 1